MPRSKKRDWFDYLGPAISSLAAAAILLIASKGCSTASDTHAAITKLSDSTIPLLQKDVSQTKTDVSGLQSNLEQKNQGLQTQIRGLYEAQSKTNEKIGSLEVEQAKVNAQLFIPNRK